MYSFYSSTLSAVFLSVISSATFALSSERPSTYSHPQLTELSHSQEVPLWPEDTNDLQNGIRALAIEKWAITHPSFLLYSPKILSARSAIIVFPDGGYKALAIGQKSTIGFNGADVCKWLTDSGVTCILLKYRVPNTGCNWSQETHMHVTPDIPMALQDAQRAISIVRYNAKKYGIESNKIGVMGFSAGGNMAVLSSTVARVTLHQPGLIERNPGYENAFA